MNEATKDDGGPAFPTTVHNNSLETVQAYNGVTLRAGEMVEYGGMKLRDYFAAKAMQSIVLESFMHGKEFGHTPDDAIASYAYRMADAMLRERAK